jgi:hypothetical protein
MFENQPSKKPATSGSVHIQTRRRYIPQDGNIHNYRCGNLNILHGINDYSDAVSGYHGNELSSMVNEPTRLSLCIV